MVNYFNLLKIYSGLLNRDLRSHLPDQVSHNGGQYSVCSAYYCFLWLSLWPFIVVIALLSVIVVFHNLAGFVHFLSSFLLAFLHLTQH